MKQFNSLLNALHFQIRCPLCQGELQSNSYINLKQKIALGFLNDSFYIDIATENIELVTNDDGQVKNNYGLLGLSVTVACNDCYMYSFIIQIWIDFKSQRITKIILNSERVSWEDEYDVLHEIVSAHSINKTKYSYFYPDTSRDDGQIILPFVSIDVTNPKDAVARIQKLIVFS